MPKEWAAEIVASGLRVRDFRSGECRPPGFAPGLGAGKTV